MIRACAITLWAGALLGVAACGTSGTSGTQRAKPETRTLIASPGSGASIALDLLAAMGATSPERVDRAISTAGYEDAVRMLALPNIDPEPVERLINERAASAYTAARAALVSDQDPSAAIGLYERALALDPDSPSIARALAEVKLLTNDRSGAGELFRRAFGLGDRSFSTLLRVAQSGGPLEERLACAVAAYELASGPRGSVPESTVSGVVLGRLLLDAGADRAGIETLDRALTLLGPEALTDPLLRREVIEISSRRAEFLTLTGDVLLRMGDARAASERYTLASRSVERVPPPLVVRSFAAAIESTDPDQAAAGLVRALVTDPGVLGHVTQRAMETAASDPKVSRAVTEALTSSIRSGDATPSVRAALLTHAAIASGSAQAAARLIIEAPEDCVSPLACASMLVRAGSDDLSIAARVASSNPDALAPLTDALLVTRGDPARMIASLSESRNPGSRTLARSIAAAIGRADLVGTTDADPGSLSTPEALVELRIATQTRRFDLASTIVARELDRAGSMTPSQRASLLGALTELGWADAASTLRTQIEDDPDPSADELLALSRVYASRSEHERQLNALERGLSRDPSDERLYEGIIALRGPSGALPDEDELRIAARDLTRTLPSSPLVTLIRAGEAAAQGLLAESERMLVELNDQNPHRTAGLDLLTRIWGTLQDQGDENALERGLAWVQDRATESPGTPSLVRTEAQLLNTLGRRGESLRSLERTAERYPARWAQRLHEGLVRLEDQRRADELAIERLGNAPLGLELGIERLEILTRTRAITPEDQDRVLPENAPVSMSPDQSRRVIANLSALLQDTGEHDGFVLEIARRAKNMTSDQGIVGAMLQIEMVALAGSDEYTPDAFEGVVRDAIRIGTGDTDPAQIAIQALTRAGRSGVSTELLARLTIRDNAIDPARLTSLMRVLARDADAQSVVEAVRVFDEQGLASEAAAIAQESIGTSARPDPERGDPSADTLYTIAVIAMFFERDEHALEIYRAALERNPDHAWALNDLGYHLVERGESLDEALRMLERALSQLPQSASVTDSYAWALYATGSIADDGETPGAATLLERASTLDPTNATVFDHLGDARWMLGLHNAAIDAWLRAESILRDRLKGLVAQNQPNTDAVDRVREQLRTIRYKISDVETGVAPKVAPSRADPLPPIDPQDP